jgi:hypothetical protein
MNHASNSPRDVVAGSASRTRLFSLVLALFGSACASEVDPILQQSLALSDADSMPTEHPPTGLAPSQPEATEVSAPRIVATYEGGLLVLDGRSLDVVSEHPLAGFLRLAPAGDERHVVVSTDNAYRFLDTGVTIDDHGDHAHYYAVPPRLTDLTVASQHPGHVTNNAGLTALFSDGSGRVELFDPSTLVSGTTRFSAYTAPAPHHGVAVALALPQGGLLVTVGTE